MPVLSRFQPMYSFLSTEDDCCRDSEHITKAGNENHIYIVNRLHVAIPMLQVFNLYCDLSAVS